MTMHFDNLNGLSGIYGLVRPLDSGAFSEMTTQAGQVVSQVRTP
jgi:hypothetical protein